MAPGATSSSRAHGRSPGRHGTDVRRPRRGRRAARPRRALRSCRCRRSCTAPRTGSRSSTWLTGGDTVVIQDDVDRFDAADVLRRGGTRAGRPLPIVGDAFARPLLDELERGDYDLSALAAARRRRCAVLPAGSRSELLRRAARRCAARRARLVGDRPPEASHVTPTGTATPGHVQAAAPAPRWSSTRIAPACSTPGDDEIGWLASSGRVPLGYLGDAGQDGATFPTIDGVRYAVPGDRARLRDRRSHRAARPGLGHHQLRRREDLRRGGRAGHQGHTPRCTTCSWSAGRASAGARSRGGRAAARRARGDRRRAAPSVAGRHVARYKLPKAFVFTAPVPRSPSGKPDYAAAKALL